MSACGRCISTFDDSGSAFESGQYCPSTVSLIPFPPGTACVSGNMVVCSQRIFFFLLL